MTLVGARAAAVAGAIVVAAALGVWLATRGHSGAPALGPTVTAPATTASPVGPVELTATALRARAGTLRQDVYWLGPQPGATYELERTATGAVFVRYVTGGGGRDVTTVGTYPLPNAYAATTELAREPGATEVHVEGWLAVARASAPDEIYLAAQGFPYQIEVYDPSPAHARELVESGAVGPVR
jgi:hypothetical protein